MRIIRDRNVNQWIYEGWDCDYKNVQHGHPLHRVTKGITVLYYLHLVHANAESGC